MSAPERIPAPALSVDDALGLLVDGDLTVHGRLSGASNTVLHASVTRGGHRLPCVYKPVAGERPLWDFPDGTLAQREVAAFEVCRALDWDLVPPTVLRDGPLGPGMCQEWIGPPPAVSRAANDARAGQPPGDSPPEGGPPDGGPGPTAADAAVERLLALVESTEPEPGWKAVGHAEIAPGRTALLVHADDRDLRRLSVLDAVINNGDRKGGHLLALPGGPLRAIDHGVSFHTEGKLRTLLWGWADEPLPPDVVASLEQLAARLADGRATTERLAALITAAELDALRERTAALLAVGRHPVPSGAWPAIPWPLV